MTHITQKFPDSVCYLVSCCAREEVVYCFLPNSTNTQSAKKSSNIHYTVLFSMKKVTI